MRLVDNRDVVAGIVLAAVGCLFVYGASGLEFGSPRRMGPGFFPTLVGSITILLGLCIGIIGLKQQVEIQRPTWRPVSFVLAGIAVFGVTIPYLGLLPAVVLSVLVSAFAARGQSRLKVLLLALVASFAIWLIFSVALGLSVPALRIPF